MVGKLRIDYSVEKEWWGREVAGAPWWLWIKAEIGKEELYREAVEHR